VGGCEERGVKERRKRTRSKLECENYIEEREGYDKGERTYIYIDRSAIHHIQLWGRVHRYSSCHWKYNLKIEFVGCKNHFQRIRYGVERRGRRATAAPL
jgi:hypothetical protein